MRGEGGYNPASPERVKRESVSDRFNGAVVRELEKKFEDTHNVVNEYFTHAFPFNNLANIVNTGGLVTPNELRRRGASFKEGSSAGYGETIFFSKDEIQGNYSVFKEKEGGDKNPVWSAILVPAQEFKRVSRLNSSLSSGHVLSEEGYTKPGSRVNMNEFPLVTEASGDSFTRNQAVRSAEAIAHKLYKKKVAEIEESTMKLIAQAEKDFEDEIKNLSPVSEEEIKEMSDQARVRAVERIDIVVNATAELKQIGELIVVKEKECNILERDNNYDKNGIQYIIGLEKPSLTEKVMERFGVKTKRQTKIEGLNGQIEELDETLNAARGEIKQLKLKSEEIKQKLEHLKILHKLVKEKKEKILVIENSQKEETDTALKYYSYREGRYSVLGEGFKKIRGKMRKAYGVDEAERAAKVNIDHSVILIDISGAEEALKATESKPDLRSRIVLVDGSKLANLAERLFPKGIVVLGTLGSAGVLDVLTKSEEGFELLKSAQSGRTGGKSIEGLTSLVDYLSQKQEAIAA